MVDQRIECRRCNWKNDERAIICTHCGCGLRPNSPVFLADPKERPTPPLDLSPWKPEPFGPAKPAHPWNWEVIVAALLICLTLIFWIEIREWLVQYVL